MSGLETSGLRVQQPSDDLGRLSDSECEITDSEDDNSSVSVGTATGDSTNSHRHLVAGRGVTHSPVTKTSLGEHDLSESTQSFDTNQLSTGGSFQSAKDNENKGKNAADTETNAERHRRSKTLSTRNDRLNSTTHGPSVAASKERTLSMSSMEDEAEEENGT